MTEPVTEKTTPVKTAPKKRAPRKKAAPPADTPAGDRESVAIEQYGPVGWGCECGWVPNYNHSMGLGLQQQRHFETNHGTFTRP